MHGCREEGMDMERWPQAKMKFAVSAPWEYEKTMSCGCSGKGNETGRNTNKEVERAVKFNI